MLLLAAAAALASSLDKQVQLEWERVWASASTNASPETMRLVDNFRRKWENEAEAGPWVQLAQRWHADWQSGWVWSDPRDVKHFRKPGSSGRSGGRSGRGGGGGGFEPCDDLDCGVFWDATGAVGFRSPLNYDGRGIDMTGSSAFHLRFDELEAGIGLGGTLAYTDWHEPEFLAFGDVYIDIGDDDVIGQLIVGWHPKGNKGGVEAFRNAIQLRGQSDDDGGWAFFGLRLEHEWYRRPIRAEHTLMAKVTFGLGAGRTD